MDVFSHGIWTGLAAKGVNYKYKKNLNPWLTAFWGVFPDVSAFLISFIWLFYDFMVKGLGLNNLPHPDDIEPAHQNTNVIFRLTSTLYNISHSALVFLAVFTLVYFFFRRPIWEMWGWILHILIDIPTHSYEFYPTPFLWPVSNWRFNGFSWTHYWFMIANYSIIIILAVVLWRKNKHKKKEIEKIK